MKDPILVSIILPVYNGADYLSKSIQSCLDQTYSNLELIIVDDASTDDSLRLAEEFASKDNRVMIISNQVNKNLPASLNIGHKNAKGKFITWTSHDNYYDISAIEKMLDEILFTKADIVFSDFVIIDSANRRTGLYKYNSASSIILENTVRACFLYDRLVFERNEGYDEQLFKIEDYDFWLRASLHSTFRHLPEVLYYYRKHSESLTAGKTISQFVYQDDYLRNVEKMYLNFLQKSGIKNETLSTLLKDLHLNQKLDVYSFLASYKELRKDFDRIIYEKENVGFWSEVDKKIRANLIRFPQSRKIGLLYLIVKVRPQILYSYSKRKSLRILFKVLFK